MKTWTLAIEESPTREQAIVRINSIEELIAIVTSIVTDGEGAFSMCPFGYSYDTESLLSCVDRQYAFCQFTPRKPGDPRSTLWVEGRNSQSEGYIDFNLGGTPTSIGLVHCITHFEMMAIVRHYYVTTELWSGVTWGRPTFS
jgi:hypothetical protein